MLASASASRLYFLSSFFIILSDAVPVPAVHLTSRSRHVSSVSSRSFEMLSARSITRSYAQHFASSSRDHQTDIDTPFPTYALVLLALFIVICGLSSAGILLLLFYKKTHARARAAARRVVGPATGVRPIKLSKWGDESVKSKKESQLDATQAISDSSVPTNNCDTSNVESTAVSSREKVDTSLTLSTGDAPDYDEKGKPAVTYDLSPDTSGHFDSSQASSSPESLRRLVSISKTAFQRLSDIISLPKDAIDDFPNDEISTMQAGNPSNTEYIHSLTSKNTRIFQGDDDNSPHTASSQHSTSSTAFYSLGDVLSPSIAVHSLVDLDNFATSQGSDSVPTAGLLEVLEERDITDEFSSPRYVPGMQLETIQEESESFSSMSQRTLARSNSVIPSTSRKSYLEPTTDMNTPAHSNPDLNQRTTSTYSQAMSNASMDTSSYSPTIFWTDRIPSTWEDLVTESQNLSLPRFFPAARPAPLPSEPTSGVALVTALRSPYRNERRHSVAWLSPVIEWVADTPGENVNGNSATGDDGDQCEDALCAADAMAIVMDSLASIGMDPTDIGFMTEDVASPSLSTSDVLPDSPTQPPADRLTSGESFHSKAARADEVEEDEVEKEIGGGSGFMFLMTGRSGEDIKTPRPCRLISSPQIQSKIEEGVTRLRDLDSSAGLLEGSNSTWNSDLQRKSPVEQHHNDIGKRPLSSSAVGSGGSLSSNQSSRTPRGVNPDRVYPSPSSLAGLSPAEVSKRFSSSASTPPHEKSPVSPQHNLSPVSPLQARKAKGRSLSPTAMTSSPLNESGPSSPSSHSPLLSSQHTTASPRRSLNSPRSLSARKNLRHSISSPQRPKPMEISRPTRPPSVLQEKSNSMEFF